VRAICIVLMCHFSNCADCGSGIGRVTKNFLLRHFNEVCNLSSLWWFVVMLHSEDKCLHTPQHLVAVGISYHDTGKKQHTSILLLYTELIFYVPSVIFVLCLICMFWPFLKTWNLAIQVDLVEPVSHFLEVARENLTVCMDQGEDSHKAANFYCVPLQVGTHRSLSLVRCL
jgi:hypothetical protein